MVEKLRLNYKMIIRFNHIHNRMMRSTFVFMDSLTYCLAQHVLWIFSPNFTLMLWLFMRAGGGSASRKVPIGA